MLAAGDELDHSQGGNNNPYCQDNATTWIDWARADESLIAFTAQVLALRRAWLPLDDAWFDGQADAAGQSDLLWLGADGRPLDAAQWNDPSDRVLGACVRRAGRGARPLLLLFNAGAVDVPFALPAGEWRLLLDSSADRTGRASADRSFALDAAAGAQRANAGSAGRLNDAPATHQRRPAASQQPARPAWLWRLWRGGLPLRRLAGGGGPVAVADPAAQRHRRRQLPLRQQLGLCRQPAVHRPARAARPGLAARRRDRARGRPARPARRLCGGAPLPHAAPGAGRTAFRGAAGGGRAALAVRGLLRAPRRLARRLCAVHGPERSAARGRLVRLAA